MSVETREREDGKFGRRSLVRAGVWAIPVVTVAAAAPALAVSGAKLGGTWSAKSKNAHEFTFTFTVNNTASGTVTGFKAKASITGTNAVVKSISGTSWSQGADKTMATAPTLSLASGAAPQTITLSVGTSNNPDSVTLQLLTDSGSITAIWTP